MRNKYRTLILFTVAITMIAITKTVYAQRIDPVSVYYPQLQEYLRIAAEENPELRSLWHQYRSELEVIPKIGTLHDPEDSIGYTINHMMPNLFLSMFSISDMKMFPWIGILQTGL